MASLISTVFRAQLTLLSPILKGMDFERQRRTQDRLAKLGERALAFRVVYKNMPLTQCKAAWAIPRAGRIHQAVLYLHGGGYTAGNLTYAKGFGGLLAQQTGRAVLCPAYRLAPENPYPAALDDALEAYRAVLNRFHPRDIALVGESAGGGLCLALALKLRELGLPLPRVSVIVSPWVDLTLSHLNPNRLRLDPLLSPEYLRLCSEQYAGTEALDSAFVSPLFADLSGLMPTLITAGTDEILYEEILALQDKMRQAGALSRLHVAADMWHAYPLYGMPESRETLALIVEVLHNPELLLTDDARFVP